MDLITVIIVVYLLVGAMFGAITTLRVKEFLTVGQIILGMIILSLLWPILIILGFFRK